MNTETYEEWKFRVKTHCGAISFAESIKGGKVIISSAYDQDFEKGLGTGRIQTFGLTLCIPKQNPNQTNIRNR